MGCSGNHISEKRASETYLRRLPEFIGRTDPKIDFAIGDDNRDVSKFRYWWGYFVESYSKTALGRPSNKLIAIAGLAKRMQLALRNISCWPLEG